jgi:copper chaperone CopZ
MKKFVMLMIALVFVAGFLPATAGAAEKKVTLMLDGRFCRFYPKEITEALMGVEGVTGVDLESMAGHAIVTHDGSVKPDALVGAMKELKGTKMGIEWSCKAEVMEAEDR